MLFKKKALTNYRISIIVYQQEPVSFRETDVFLQLTEPVPKTLQYSNLGDEDEKK